VAKETRITLAHQSVRRTRWAIGVGATLAFVGVGVAARVAHPGTATAHRQQTSAATSQGSATQQSDDSFFSNDDSSSAISPSQSSVPSIQSSGS